MSVDLEKVLIAADSELSVVAYRYASRLPDDLVAEIKATVSSIRAALAEGHVVEFDADGWFLQHAVRCRRDLAACEVWAALVDATSSGRPPRAFGRYAVSLVDGDLVYGEEGS